MKFDDIVHFTGNRSVCPPATRSTLSPFALSTIVKNQDRSDHPPQALRVIIVVWYGMVYAAPWVSLYLPARNVEGHLIPGMGVHVHA